METSGLDSAKTNGSLRPRVVSLWPPLELHPCQECIELYFRQSNKKQPSTDPGRPHMEEGMVPRYR